MRELTSGEIICIVVFLIVALTFVVFPLLMMYSSVEEPWTPPSPESIKRRKEMEDWHDRNIGGSGFGDEIDPPSLR